MYRRQTIKQTHQKNKSDLWADLLDYLSPRKDHMYDLEPVILGLSAGMIL